jgi:hypothetical protein
LEAEIDLLIPFKDQGGSIAVFEGLDVIVLLSILKDTPPFNVLALV